MPLVQIFAKPPIEGKVKTRLMSKLGAAKAAQVYRFCLQFTLELLRASGLPYQVWLSEAGTDIIFDGESCHLQKGDNLGDRMIDALQHGFRNNPDEPILLIGSDCLDITEKYIYQAIESLKYHDLVLLPCLDGGFAMIGCQNIHPTIFDNVKWSSETVLQQVLNNANGLDYRVDKLETVRDIDTLNDLNHYPELRELIARP